VVKTAIWDIVAWNRAAAAVLTNCVALPPEERNVLRLLFCNPYIRAKMVNWKSEARFAVALFRSDAARTGASESVGTLVDELSRLSPEFAAIWDDHDVRSYGEGIKRFPTRSQDP
jgi:hypothetical protein